MPSFLTLASKANFIKAGLTSNTRNTSFKSEVRLRSIPNSRCAGVITGDSSLCASSRLKAMICVTCGVNGVVIISFPFILMFLIREFTYFC